MTFVRHIMQHMHVWCLLFVVMLIIIMFTLQTLWAVNNYYGITCILYTYVLGILCDVHNAQFCVCSENK